MKQAAKTCTALKLTPLQSRLKHTTTGYRGGEVFGLYCFFKFLLDIFLNDESFGWKYYFLWKVKYQIRYSFVSWCILNHPSKESWFWSSGCSESTFWKVQFYFSKKISGLVLAQICQEGKKEKEKHNPLCNKSIFCCVHTDTHTHSHYVAGVVLRN